MYSLFYLCTNRYIKQYVKQIILFTIIQYQQIHLNNWNVHRWVHSFVCPFIRRFPLALSNQWIMAPSALKLDSEGPLIFISNRSFMELFPRDVRLALFTMFMWLNPLSTIAVLIESVIMISRRGKKCLIPFGGIASRFL